LSVAQGAALALLCGLLGGALGATLGFATLAVLGIYAALSLTYSLYLKRVLLFDVAVLAILYCLRVVVGGVAADITLSPWLTALMIFEFFGLAMVKRSVELTRVASASSGRAYRAEDRPTIRAVGIASTLLGTLVFALYVNDPASLRLYAHPQVLWLAVPVLLYWSARLWVFEDRGVITDDPLVFVATDRVSWLAGLTIGAVLLAASW
jgi:4-hydroxybenzoate polyprenyltransferase